MQFSTKVAPSLKAAAVIKTGIECLVVPVAKAFGGNGIGQSADQLGEGLLQQIQSVIHSGDLGQQIGQSVVLYPTSETTSSPVLVRRIVLVNFGWNLDNRSNIGVAKTASKPASAKSAKHSAATAVVGGSSPIGSTESATATLSAKQFQDAIRASLRTVMPLKVKQVDWLLEGLPVQGKTPAWIGRSICSLYAETHYKFSELKTGAKSQEPASTIVQLQIICSGEADSALFEKGLNDGQALASGVGIAKRLGNLPGNFCTPTYLANHAKQLGKAYGFKVEVLEKKQLQALKMGSFLSVAQGSDEPPKLIVMQYKGASSKVPPVALVGKGITFDTGGISLKPGAEMDEMKFDMCGAASVIGAFAAIAQMNLKVNVVGVVPACENMPSGSATKPGDIFTSMSGKTIEVLNTDAEGRLILCDALTFVRRFNPSAVVDIATLTGACVIALGHHHSGLFSNVDGLAHELIDAGQQSGDTCWRMPLDDAYNELLKSNFADMANIGGRAGGAITAACFLARFTEGLEWAHLDIAGTAWKSGAAKGSSGRPVPLLVQFLENRAQA